MSNSPTISKIADKLCQYTTVRKVSVRDKGLATTYWCILFLVLLYVVIYTIVYSKGYQTFDEVVGSVSLKVKGTGSACSDFNTSSDWKNPNCTVYDAVDLVYPSVELNALFLTTSITQTADQKQTVCDGNDDVIDCESDADCVENTFDSNSQGIYTGVCGNSTQKCEVYGWCPLEDDSVVTYINNVGQFTVFVSMNVRFPSFSKDRSNTYDKNGDGSPITGLNLFRINYIVRQAIADDTYNLTGSRIAGKGAVILSDVQWNCNFDRDDDDCEPAFDWYRLDDQDGSISSGFNFRTAIYDFDDSDDVTRTLRKLRGLRIIFLVSGSGGMFNFAALTLTFGAGIAYLGVASLLTDIVLANCLKESNVYSEKKTERVRKSIVREEIAKTKQEEYDIEAKKWADDDDVDEMKPYQPDDDETEQINEKETNPKQLELQIRNNDDNDNQQQNQNVANTSNKNEEAGQSEEQQNNADANDENNSYVAADGMNTLQNRLGMFND